MGVGMPWSIAKEAWRCSVIPQLPTRSRESTCWNQMQILPSRPTPSNLFLLARPQFPRFWSLLIQHHQ